MLKFIVSRPGALRHAVSYCAALAMCLAPAVIPAAPADTSASLNTYTNPFDFSIADPFIYKEGDTYNMYGTTEEWPGQGFDVYQSTDLVTWNRAGRCYAPGEKSWGQGSFWAPEVIKSGDSYYLHYTVLNRTEGRRNILVAKGDSPTGPFEDYAGPIIPEISVIDSHIYHDPRTNDYYFYYVPEHKKPQGIWGAKISSDFKTFLTTPTRCLTAELNWEDDWIEGPIIHEHKGTYYMMYSGGAYWEAEYSLGYATADNPLGPWTKAAENPVLKPNSHREGPGHNGLALSPDGKELFCVYHLHVGDWSIRRVAGMDRIEFVAAPSGPDRLTMPGAPSWQPQPMPTGAPARTYAQSDDFNSSGPDMHRWRVFNNNPAAYKQADGALEIAAQPGDIWRSHNSGRNIFLQPAPAGDFTLETKVDMDTARQNEQAFLVLWNNQDDYLTFAAADNKFAIAQEAKGKVNTRLREKKLAWPLHLRLQRSGNAVTFSASEDGTNWHQVDFEADISNLDVRDVGIGAWSPGENRGTIARFDWFRVTQD